MNEQELEQARKVGRDIDEIGNSVSTSGGQHVSSEIALRDRGQSYVSNFDGDKMNQWRLKSLACGGDALRFEDMPDGEMELKYFYCHMIEMVSRDGGEYVNNIRTVLVTPDDKCYAFVSDYIAREIDGLVQMWGKGPWMPPLRIRIKKFRTRNGNQCYSIGPA